MLNITQFKALKIIIFILACAAPLESNAAYTQYCIYPDTPDTNFMDGGWEKAAGLSVDRPLFFIFYLKPRFYIRIWSQDGKIEYEQDWPADAPPSLFGLSCVWQSETLVKITVENEGGGQVHPDLPVSMILEF